MYDDCLFCTRPFDRNAALESLQVGRRIAFDPTKGRLWVVCRGCERWNLVPIEARWEAIEDAERLFRETRLRMSTEQIGLARLKEGTDLVRVGKPLRPEFAAWRYGDQFGRRRRKMLLIGTAVAATAGTFVTAGLITGLLSVSVLAQSGNFINLWINRRTAAKVTTPEGRIVKLTGGQLNETTLGRFYDGTWYLQVPGKSRKPQHEFTGPSAESVAALLLPRINSGGATQRQVSAAVNEIETRGGPEAYMNHLIKNPPLKSSQMKSYAPERGIALGVFPLTHRLALEMALHEERERQLMAGELQGLESAWLAAEDIAAIADDLLIPAAVRAMLEEHQDRTDGSSA
jgi:hypothetical protein